jgi:hypothetical protein
MLKSVRPTASPRRLRLFAAGCCRMALNPFASPAARLVALVAVLAAEQPIDPRALERIRARASEEARAAVAGYFAQIADACAHALDADPWDAAVQAPEAAARAAADAGYAGLNLRGDWLGVGQVLYRAERSAQADLARCVFANPSRPPALDPFWRTPTVLALAHGIEEEWAFDRLPILADALEDAGCADEQILGHCRGGGPHALGCWAIDLLLGKE